MQELFDYYSNLRLEKEKHIEIRDRTLTKYAPVAVTRWLQAGEKDKARECLQSKYYSAPKTIRGFIKYVIQMVWMYFSKTKKNN